MSDSEKSSLGKACLLLFSTMMDFIPKSIKMVVDLNEFKKEKERIKRQLNRKGVKG